MTRVFSDTSAAPPRRETAMPSMVPRWEGGEDCLWRDRQEWEEEQQAREKGRQIDFDLELAMLSPSGRFSSTAPMEGDPHNSWFVAERANSLDGRRNGWLEDSSGDTEEGEMGSGSGGGGDCDDCAKSSGSCGHLKVKLSSGRSRGSSSDRKQGSIEMELAKVTGNKPWEMIYDGRSNL